MPSATVSMVRPISISIPRSDAELLCKLFKTVYLELPLNPTTLNALTRTMGSISSALGSTNTL